MRKSYGVGYMGGKTQLVKWLFSLLPKNGVFIDLFGGGGAVTHYAASLKCYDKIIYNEKNPIIANGIAAAANGEYDNRVDFVNRETFYQTRDTDFFNKIAYSFGNDGRTYCYSKEKEPFFEKLHNFIFKEDIEPLIENGFDREQLEKILDIKDLYNRRFALKKMIQKSKPNSFNMDKDGRISHVERIERIKSLKEWKEYDISIFNKDYSEIEIPNNAVVYCDIPYKNTHKYESDFDYDRFYQWALSQKNPIYISEYSMPENFRLIGEKQHRRSFEAQAASVKTLEKLYCNR